MAPSPGPKLTLILDAGEKFFQRKRQRCALVATVESNGRISAVRFLRDAPAPEAPIVPIHFDRFQLFVRVLKLVSKSRSKRSPDERRAAKREASIRCRARRAAAATQGVSS